MTSKSESKTKLGINTHHLKGNAIQSAMQSLQRFWRNLVSLRDSLYFLVSFS